MGLLLKWVMIRQLLCCWSSGTKYLQVPNNAPVLSLIVGEMGLESRRAKEQTFPLSLTGGKWKSRGVEVVIGATKWGHKCDCRLQDHC